MLEAHLAVGVLWGCYVAPDVRIDISLYVFFFKPMYNNYGSANYPRCTDTIVKHDVRIGLR